MNILKTISILAIVLMLAGCVENTTTTIPSTEVSTIETLAPKVINTPIPDERVIDITYSHKVNDYIGMRESGSSSGMTYLFITMTIENHGYNKFNVNNYNWGIEINNIRYNHHWVTYELNDAFSSQDIMDGGQLTGSVAFEIPRNGTNPDNYKYTIVYEEMFDDYNINYHNT